MLLPSAHKDELGCVLSPFRYLIKSLFCHQYHLQTHTLNYYDCECFPHCCLFLSSLRLSVKIKILEKEKGNGNVSIAFLSYSTLLQPGASQMYLIPTLVIFSQCGDANWELLKLTSNTFGEQQVWKDCQKGFANKLSHHVYKKTKKRYMCLLKQQTVKSLFSQDLFLCVYKWRRIAARICLFWRYFFLGITWGKDSQISQRVSPPLRFPLKNCIDCKFLNPTPGISMGTGGLFYRPHCRIITLNRCLNNICGNTYLPGMSFKSFQYIYILIQEEMWVYISFTFI